MTYRTRGDNIIRNPGVQFPAYGHKLATGEDAQYYLDGFVSTRCIQDVYEKFGSGVWPFKPCIKTEFTPDKIDTTAYGSGIKNQVCQNYTQSSVFERISTSSCYLYGADFSEPQFSRVVPEKYWSQLGGRMEASMPSMLTDAEDLLVTVGEIGEVLTLLNFLREKTIATAVAAAHLTWSFALRPMLSTLLGLAKAGQDWKSRLEAFKLREGKVYTRRIALDIPDETVSNIDDTSSDNLCYSPNNPGAPCPLGGYRKQWDVWHRQIAATYKYRLRLADLGKYLELCAKLSAFGVSPSVGTVWELIPFSFVVDWFYDFGYWFDQVGWDPNPVRADIIDVCTVERHYMTAWSAYNWPCYGISWDNQLDYSTLAIVRKVRQEALSDLPRLELPGFSQFLLGVSLGTVLTG